MPANEPLDIAFRIGVAWLRVGETRNCVTRYTEESCILPIRGSGVHVDQEPSTQAVHYLTQVLQQAEE